MFVVIMCIIFFLEILGTFVIALKIADKADKDKNKNITTALVNYIRELFVKRNCFGIVLSSIVFVIGVPAFLLIILIQILVSMVRLSIIMWELGDKNKT